MLAQSSPQPVIFAAGNFVNADEFAMQHIFRFGAENICEATSHARSEIEADWTEHQNDAASHVFAAVLANAFDDGESAAVANCKAFTGATSDKELSRSCAVQNRVSGEHVAAPRSSSPSGNRDSAS